jgi:single-stranded DNA-binding protein
VSEGKGDAKTTVWYKATAWEDDAELLMQFSKGDAIHIEGPAKVKEYQGKEYPEITAWYIARPLYKKRDQVQQQAASSAAPEDLPF